MAIPLFKIGNSLTVGMVDPQDIEALDQIRRVSKMDVVEPVLVSEQGIARVLDLYYSSAGSIDEIIRSIDEEKISEAEHAGLGEVAEEAPIIKLVNIIIVFSLVLSLPDPF